MTRVAMGTSREHGTVQQFRIAKGTSVMSDRGIQSSRWVWGSETKEVLFIRVAAVCRALTWAGRAANPEV